MFRVQRLRASTGVLAFHAPPPPQRLEHGLRSAHCAERVERQCRVFFIGMSFTRRDKSTGYMLLMRQRDAFQALN